MCDKNILAVPLTVQDLFFFPESNNPSVMCVCICERLRMSDPVRSSFSLFEREKINLSIPVAIFNCKIAKIYIGEVYIVWMLGV